MKSYKDIFIYNNEDELISYVELDNNEIAHQYLLKNRELTKCNIFLNNKKKEINKVKILFNEDCSLRHFILDGEAICRVVRKNSHSISPPNEEARITLKDNKKIDFFSIKKNLIEDWLKLL